MSLWFLIEYLLFTCCLNFFHLSFPGLVFHPPCWFTSQLVRLELHLNILVFISAIKMLPKLTLGGEHTLQYRDDV